MSERAASTALCTAGSSPVVAVGSAGVNRSSNGVDTSDFINAFHAATYPSPPARRAGGVGVEAGVFGGDFHFVLVGLPRQQRPDALDDLVDRERLALHLVQPLGVHQEAV